MFTAARTGAPGSRCVLATTDPAVASSIFVTMATDIASMAMLLGLATLLV